VIAAVEFRRARDHPAWAAIAEHRMAVRQLLEDLVKPLDGPDPAAVAARLQRLSEAAEALAVAGEAPGGLGLQELAEAARHRTVWFARVCNRSAPGPAPVRPWSDVG
jgi:hypothetical protein